MGFGVWGLGFSVWGLGFRVWGLGPRLTVRMRVGSRISLFFTPRTLACADLGLNVIPAKSPAQLHNFCGKEYLTGFKAKVDIARFFDGSPEEDLHIHTMRS